MDTQSTNEETRMLQKTNKASSRGFTLMELMVVVVIVGVLSAVAVPSIQKFIRTSRESEATTNLGAIARGATSYYQQDHVNTATGIVLPSQYPNSRVSAGSFTNMPTQNPCQQIAGSAKYSASAARWHNVNQVWVDLKFSLASSHYFQYSYSDNRQTNSNATYTLRARADLDCDRQLSTFLLGGRIDPTTGEQRRGRIVVLKAGE